MSTPEWTDADWETPGGPVEPDPFRWPDFELDFTADEWATEPVEVCDRIADKHATTIYGRR